MSYFTRPGINWSRLSRMRESALAYHYGLTAPEMDSDDMRIGRAVHAFFLEPAGAAEQYVVWDGGTRSGKKWDAFAEEHSGCEILRASDYDRVMAMTAALNAHQAAAGLLAGAMVETPITWTDAASGLLCKAKPDILARDQSILSDLKTCVSIDERRFATAAWRYGYWHQIAHYAAGVAAHYGRAVQKYNLICIEKSPPHDIVVFKLDPDDVAFAADEVSALLMRVKECESTGTWPGRYDGPQQLPMPGYVTGSGEIEVEYV